MSRSPVATDPHAGAGRGSEAGRRPPNPENANGAQNPVAGRPEPGWDERERRYRLIAMFLATVVLMGVLLAGVALLEWRRAPGVELPPVLDRIAINEADAATLQLLPGIGPALSERIIASRADAGRFAEPADLQRVHGIGPTLTERITPWVRFDAPRPGPTRIEGPSQDR